MKNQKRTHSAQSSMPNDAAKAEYPKLFELGGKFEASRICGALGDGSAKDKDFSRNLSVLTEFAKSSLSNLMFIAEHESHFDVHRRLAAMRQLIAAMVESVKRLEAFERSEMKKFPARGLPSADQPRQPSILHCVAWQSEFWPGLFSDSGRHANERQKFIANELELAFAHHRKPSRNTRAAAEWWVAKELLDKIHEFRTRRFENPEKPHWLEAWNLRPPVDNSWWDVAEKFLEELYGKEIGENPKFAHWLNRKYTDDDGDGREHSLGQVGILSTRIRQRIKECFLAQTPRLVVSRSK